VTSPKLNIAGRLAGAFVTSKLTVLFMIACAILGITAVLTTPREENPQITMPGAVIEVVLPGSSPEEVEEQVIRPLEGIVKQIPGVDHTYGTAMNSAGLLMVQFKVGEDKEKSLVKLYDRVLGERGKLPAEASAPFIRSADADDVPVVTVTLASSKYDDYALKRLADRMVEGLRSIDSVSTTFVKGGRDRQLRIDLDPERMQAYGVTLDQVRALVAASNVSVPLGTQVEAGQNHNVKLQGFITSEEDLKRLVVGGHEGRPIYLGEVAHVVDGPADEIEQQSRFGYGRASGKFGATLQGEAPAVTLAVAKKHGTNAVFFAHDVLERVNRMKAEWVPADVDVVVTRNDGKKADDAVNTLIEHLAIAVGSVFVVTALFLGLKEALIVGITVPLILSLTLATVDLAGLTINRVTLFGLILALGLLVDAAIVVIENIHRNYGNLRQQDKAWVSVISANEIGNPTNLATLAVVVVFYSLIPALTGMPKQYFYPVGVTVPVAMIASLLVAYCVVPWAANRWLQPEAHAVESAEDHSRLHRFYQAVMGPLVERARPRNIVFALAIGAVVLSLLLPLWQFVRPSGVGGPQSWFGVPMSLLPKDNKNTFNVTIDMPDATPVEETDRAARDVVLLLRSVPEVNDYQVWLGETGVVDFNAMLRGTDGKVGPNVAEIRVNLSDKHLRSKSSIQIARELRSQIARLASRYPGSTIQVAEDPPGPPLRATVLAEIYGQDRQQMRALSKQVKSQFRQTFDMAEVTDTEMTDVPESRLVVDREKAALSGVTPAEVAIALRRIISGEQLGTAHIGGEKNPVPINLHIPHQYEVTPALLSQVTITNRAGQRIPLSELIRVDVSATDYPIHHKDGERVTYVGGELGSTASAYAVLDLDKRLRQIRLPDGRGLVTGNLSLSASTPDTIGQTLVLWDGEMRMTLDAYRDLLGALAASLTVIFLILVAYYRSFALPLIAMAAIPLGVAGIFPGHWLMGQQFSASSLVGVVALAGVVVRNSLLLIDFVIDYRRKGLSTKQAVLKAGAVRMRPILLTALAIIFGSMIMLTDPVFSGLAVSLIFGTAVSTVLTLAVVPLMLYLYFMRFPEHVASHSPALNEGVAA